MNEAPPKVRIKLTDIGNREKDVLSVLSKIQGLNDTPEQIAANIPCHISKEVSLPLAEKVKRYLEKAGAVVELEEEDSRVTTRLETAPIDNGITAFYTDTPNHISAVKSALKDQSFSDNVELFEPEPQKRRRTKKKRHIRDFLGIAVVVALVVLVGGGVWMYFSGQFSNLAERYKRNPIVGQVGILEIENDTGAELSLHHVIGTRVIERIPLDGRKTHLERGDYYIEARSGSQTRHFPVYIEGRGHQARVDVTFPTTPAPLSNTVYIPSGWFRMGNKETDVAHFGFPDEKPDIDVYVSGFFLSKYEVTNREFAEFVEAGGYDNEVYWERLIEEWSSLVEQVPSYGRVYGNDGWKSVRKYIHTRFVDTDDYPGPRLWENDIPPYEFGQDERPVIGVTLYEADAYCKWRTHQTRKVHRLPTEAEWEKAARGYEGYFFSYGNEYDGTRANTEVGNTKKVGSYPPNSYGVYDITGNVWEWVSDHYQADAYQTLTDKYRTEIRNPRIFDEATPYNRGIVRGGSFRSVNQINARTPVRYPMFPNYWHTNIGFRYVVMP